MPDDEIEKEKRREETRREIRWTHQMDIMCMIQFSASIDGDDDKMKVRLGAVGCEKKKKKKKGV